MAHVPPALADALAGRYVLERELGRGGMATVYLARDLKHDRPVALKVLSADLVLPRGAERFRREIRIAARLQHPHILTVYDSGEAAGQQWFTMPFVGGESLRDRLRRDRQLPLEDAVRVAREAAEALDYAHEHGVVHRDVKPGNILLTRDGNTLVADFGIARAAESETGDRLTATGVSVGTPEYMSPEQIAASADLDARSDIYSLGCVLYEMLAGEPPFTGRTPKSVMVKRLAGPAPSVRVLRPTVPTSVEATVARALSREASDRFGTAGELAQALRPMASAPETVATTAPKTAPAAVATPVVVNPPRGTPATPGGSGTRTRRLPVTAIALGAGFLMGLGVLFAWRRSHAGASESASPKVLAVLPFENLGDSADAYFAEGVTDEVRSKLASIGGLEVIARGSSTEYRHTTKRPQEIGRELAADYLLTATVRWEKLSNGTSRVRVTPELVDLSPGHTPNTRWSEQFDAALTDVFQVQANIASKVASALDVALGAGVSRALAARPTTNPEAYDHYLRAYAYFDRYNRIDNAIAVRLYQRTLALDSTFALAWAKLAKAHAVAYWFNWDPSPVRLDSAQHAAERALALQPDLPEGHLAMGFYHYWGHRDYQRALAEFAITARDQPNNAEVVAAIGAIQRRQGKWQDALASWKRGVELDPRSYTMLVELGLTYVAIRDYPEAERVLNRAIALAPDLPMAYGEKITVYVTWEGHLDQVPAVMDEALSHMTFGKLIAEMRYAPMVAADPAYGAELAALQPTSFGRDLVRYFWLKAKAYRFRGETERARAYDDSLAVAARAHLRERPDDGLLYGVLGVAEAHLGQRAQAIEDGRRGVELLPPSKDELEATVAEVQLAEIYAILGEPDSAIERLHAALAVPSRFSAASFRADPTWALLRGNPRFERLVAGK